jgi:16S rRNA (cytosine1402-N4)-methyltransferase
MTTGDLEAVIKEAVPGNYEHGRLNPATRTFQALRIYANDELGNLRQALKNLPEVVESGGRVAMISFHSLEDRIVKHVFREMEKEGILKIVTKKPIEATDEETFQNPRARSAKLRVAIMN